MIDIQKCPLGAFKKNFFPSLHRFMNRQNRVRNEWPDFFSNLQILMQKRFESYRFETETPGVEQFTSLTRALSFFVNNLRLQKVPYADPDSGDLVAISRPYAAPCGSNFF